MKILKTILLSFSILSMLFVPVSVMAQTPECDELRKLLDNNNGGNFSGASQQLPSYCNEGDVYAKIVGILYYIVGIAAVISIIYGGYMYMTAGSNETRKAKGKTIIIYTIAGIVLAILAALIVNAVISLIVDNKFL